MPALLDLLMDKLLHISKYSGSIGILACAPLSGERQRDANFSLCPPKQLPLVTLLRPPLPVADLNRYLLSIPLTAPTVTL